MLKILVSSKNLPVDVIELVGFQEHLADGEKNGTFIFNILLEHTKNWLY